MVDSVDPYLQLIRCRFNPAENLDLSPENAYYSIIFSDSEITQFSDISTYDVVSVAMANTRINGKPFYYLVVARQTLKGSITAKNEAQQEILIGDTFYQISQSLYGLKLRYIASLPYHEELVFLLDVCGKIAFGVNLTTAQKNYGYLLNAAVSSEPDSRAQIKLFTKDGEMRVLDLSPKVKIDSIVYTDSSQAVTALKIRPEGGATLTGAPSTQIAFARPVIYTINSNDEISIIDTDTPNCQVRKEDIDNDDNKENPISIPGTFIKYTPSELDDDGALIAGFRNARIGWISRNTNSVDGRFHITGDTLLIHVPDIDTYGLDNETFLKYASNKIDNNMTVSFDYRMIQLYELSKEDKNYRILSLSDIDHLHAYDIQGYDVDPDTGVAGLVVLRGSLQPYYYQFVPNTSDVPMQVFLRTTQVYDPELQRELTKLYYTRNGSEASVLVDKDNLLFSYRYLIEGCQPDYTPYGTEVKPLRPGDIIRVIQEGGFLTHIERVFRYDNMKETALTFTMYPTNTRVLYSSALYGMYAGGMPNDQRNLFSGAANNYYVGVGYLNKVRGNVLQVYLGKQYLNDVKPKDSSSYVEQYINTLGIPITVITPDQNGVRVKQGDLSDLIGMEEGKEPQESSIVIFKHTNHKPEQIIIINPE